MLFFRVDANEVIGTGHMMRCLAIADAARKLNYDSIFIVADHRGQEIVKNKGYQCIVLDSIWDDLNKEILQMQQVIKQYSIDTLVLDSYYVTQYYLDIIGQNTKLVYFDDLYVQVRPFDLVINYTIYADQYPYMDEYDGANLALGTSYVPLRTAFQNVSKKTIKDCVTNIMIMSGGTDAYSFILRFLSYIVENLLYSDIQFVVICGRYNQDKMAIEALAEKHPNICLYDNVDNIEKYMQEADIAISAGGTTLYELCACGTPTITYAMADNQLDNVRSFDKKNLMKYSGDVRDNYRYDHLVKEIDTLIKDRYFREQNSEALQQVVDGKGAFRIVEQIMNLK